MTPWSSSKIHHGYHEKCIIGIIKNASLNSEIVNNQDCHNTNLVLEDNIFKKQSNTKHDCQNMDKFFIAVFPFVIDKYKQNNGILANKRVEETKIFRETDAPPPPYKSMLKVFLMDEPPNYSNETGITVNVNEVRVLEVFHSGLKYMIEPLYFLIAPFLNLRVYFIDLPSSHTFLFFASYTFVVLCSFVFQCSYIRNVRIMPI